MVLIRYNRAIFNRMVKLHISDYVYHVLKMFYLMTDLQLCKEVFKELFQRHTDCLMRIFNINAVSKIVYERIFKQVFYTMVKNWQLLRYRPLQIRVN